MMLHTALVISAYMSMIFVPCACAQWGEVLTAEWRNMRRDFRLDLRRRRDGKTHLLRVDVSWQSDGRLGVRSAGGQMSHQLTGMAAANGLAIVQDGDGLPAGALLEVILFGPIEPYRST